MKETVLWQDNSKLMSAQNIIICLTFLTTNPNCVKSLIYLVAETTMKIQKLFSEAEFYSLSYIEDEERVSFYDMKMSLASLRKIKELCMALELNDNKERVADIDVHIFFKDSGKLYKVSRTDLTPKT